jgi:hypothetical protein
MIDEAEIARIIEEREETARLWARYERQLERQEARDQGFAEGFIEAKAELLAKSVLYLLDRRQVAASSASRERILACKDPERVARWLKQSATAKDADELFT